MPEDDAQHAYNTLSIKLVIARRGLGRIEDPMTTRMKVLGPVTDQGNAEQLMTTGEVAVWLQVAPKTLRNWRSAGIGPMALKLHGAVRYQRAAIEAWVADTSKAAG